MDEIPTLKVPWLGHVNHLNCVGNYWSYSCQILYAEQLKCKPWDGKLSPNGRGQSRVTNLKKMVPTGEARNFKYLMLIQNKKY